MIFFFFFLGGGSSKWPPHPQEESKCKNAQFLQWILKDEDVYFKKKIQHLKFGGIFFIVKNIGFLHNMLPPPYCVTGPRWVKKHVYEPVAGPVAIPACNVLHVDESTQHLLKMKTVYMRSTYLLQCLLHSSQPWYPVVVSKQQMKQNSTGYVCPYQYETYGWCGICSTKVRENVLTMFPLAWGSVRASLWRNSSQDMGKKISIAEFEWWVWKEYICKYLLWDISMGILDTFRSTPMWVLHVPISRT